MTYIKQTKKTIRLKTDWNWIFGFIFASFGILLCIINQGELNSYLSIFILTINGIILIYHFNNWNLFIIYGFIFYANYSILASNYIFKFNIFYTSFSKDMESAIGITILMIFNVLLFITMPKKKPKSFISINGSFFENKHQNGLIELALCCMLLLIFAFGISRPNAAGVRSDPTAYYEYAIILFILAFYYSGNKKSSRFIFAVILFAYSLQNLIYGGRITALQLIICFFLIFYQHKFKPIQLLPFMVIGLVVFSAIGNFRADFDFSIKGFTGVWSGLKENKLVLDTAYSAYYTSLTFLKTELFTNWETRIYLLGRFLLSMLLGGSVVENSILANYTRQFFYHDYGGILPFFGHFYLGWIGVALFALYVNGILRFFDKSKKNSIKVQGLVECAQIYVVSTVPRWYLYTPSALIRGLFILSIAYLVLFMVDRFTNESFHLIGNENK